MRKFKGQINGVEYTNQEEFAEAYERLTTSGTHDTINVSYSIEYVKDDKDCKCLMDKDHNQNETKLVGIGKEPVTESETSKPDTTDNLTEKESDILCDAIEKIRDIVNDTTNRIQTYIDSDSQSQRNMRELSISTDAAITKIRWIVQSLNIRLREKLCDCVYDATKDMVDNINSELVDTRYEISKNQDMISDDISEIEGEIGEIDTEIEELQKDKESLYDEINDMRLEYENNGIKIDTITTAKKFFDDLIETFEM